MEKNSEDKTWGEVLAATIIFLICAAAICFYNKTGVNIVDAIYNSVAAALSWFWHALLALISFIALWFLILLLTRSLNFVFTKLLKSEGWCDDIELRLDNLDEKIFGYLSKIDKLESTIKIQRMNFERLEEDFTALKTPPVPDSKTQVNNAEDELTQQ